MWAQVARFRNVETARPRFLEHHEAVRLVNASDPAFRSLVQAALVTGARYGELTGLRVDDYRSGKLHVGDSKSGKARWITLAGDGRFAIRQPDGRASGRRNHVFETGAVQESRWSKTSRWGESHQQEPMERACERAAIEALGFHQLRHTYASLSLMSGMPLIVLARNLGHGDTRMVERHYGHLLQSYQDQMIEAHAPKFGFGEGSKVTATASVRG